MSNPTVLNALTRYAMKKKLFSSGFEVPIEPREVLFLLYVKEGRSLAEIADLLKVTRPGVAYQVKTMGLPIHPPGRRAVLAGRARSLGYVDLRTYFERNSTRSFESMADELKVTPETVRRHYEQFVHAIESAVPA
jgi:hypothetical protein